MLLGLDELGHMTIPGVGAGFYLSIMAVAALILAALSLLGGSFKAGRIAVVVSVALLGLLVVGWLLRPTPPHPSIGPRNWARQFSISQWLNRLPSMGDLTPGATKSQQTSKPAPSIPGSLVVTIQGYNPPLRKTNLLFILDNSATMFSRDEKWTSGRWDTAIHFLERLSLSLPAGSMVAVRSFFSGFSCRFGDEEAPVTVNRLVFDWSAPEPKELSRRLMSLSPTASNDLCAACVQSMLADFEKPKRILRRITLFTDGQSRCWAAAFRQIKPSARARVVVPVDVVALGMADDRREAYLRLTSETGGILAEVPGPGNMAEALETLTEAFRVKLPLDVGVTGAGGFRNVKAGDTISLSQGVYTVILPSHLNLPSSDQSIDNVKIEPGRTTLLQVRHTEDGVRVKSLIRRREERSDDSGR